MKLNYINKRFSKTSLQIIAAAEAICEEYAAQGFDLTLRQLYYQFVARGYIANRQSEYNRLGSIVNDARLAGLLDWDYIVDRTRNLRALSHWDSPQEIVGATARQFRFDKWADQDFYVEVWIEKDALVGVIEGVCTSNDVAYFSCRGYTSQSELWGASQRLQEKVDKGKRAVIIHLGDHDPSGLDMTRDIEDRLVMFFRGDGYRLDNFPDVVRVALNMPQVEALNPPPNPAKMTDSRFTNYMIQYGDQSWELDALDPTTLAGVIQQAIDQYRDPERWDAAVESEAAEKEKLAAVSQRWDEVIGYLNGTTGEAV